MSWYHSKCMLCRKRDKEVISLSGYEDVSFAGWDSASFHPDCYETQKRKAMSLSISEIEKLNRIQEAINGHDYFKKLKIDRLNMIRESLVK